MSCQAVRLPFGYLGKNLAFGLRPRFKRLPPQGPLASAFTPQANFRAALSAWFSEVPPTSQPPPSSLEHWVADRCPDALIAAFRS
jgi:hypothetical protein